MNGLLFSIPVALFVGVSKSLSRNTNVYFGTRSNQKHVEEILFYSLGLAITAIWGIFMEGTSEALRGLELGFAPLLIFNVLSSAVAITLGKSILFSLYISKHYSCFDSTILISIGDIIYLLALAGATGCVSAIMLRRSYTTLLQIYAFSAAVLCMTIGPVRGFLHQY